MLCKYFPPNLTHVAVLLCETHTFSIMLHNVEMYYLQQTILTTELAHSKLKYGLFSRVISCHDSWGQYWLNSCSNCTPCTDMRLDDDGFLMSLSLQESDSVVFSKRWGTALFKHKKNYLRTTCTCLAVTSKEESCRDSMLSSLWHQIWAIWL